MLKFYVREDSTADVVWLHSQKEVKEFLFNLLKL
jgi:hypothetical protein